MSLVGTRPILQDELRQYELHHRARIAIKLKGIPCGLLRCIRRQIRCNTHSYNNSQILLHSMKYISLFPYNAGTLILR